MRLFITLLFVLFCSSLYAKDTALDCLSVTILKEAGNQAQKGRSAVAMVVMNRAKWNNENVCKVVKQRKQFSWYKGGSVKSYVKKDKRITLVRNDANRFLTKGKQVAINKNKGLSRATYFHASYVRPKWRLAMCNPIRIKDHIFYSECKKEA